MSRNDIFNKEITIALKCKILWWSTLMCLSCKIYKSESLWIYSILFWIFFKLYFYWLLRLASTKASYSEFVKMQILRAQLFTCCLHSRHQPQIRGAPGWLSFLTSWLQIERVPWPPLGLRTYQRNPQNSLKVLYLWLQVYHSKRLQIRTSQKKKCIEWGFQYEASIIFRDALPSRQLNVKILRVLLTGNSRISAEVLLHRHDWLNHCLCGWTQFLGFLSFPEIKMILHDSEHQCGWSFWHDHPHVSHLTSIKLSGLVWRVHRHPYFTQEIIRV